MKRFRVVVLLIFGVLVLGVLFLLYSRELTGVDFLKQFFLQQLEASLKRKIEVDRVKLVVLPSIRLELSGVAVYGHDDPSHVVFTSKNIDIVLRLLPLLRKQVVAKRIFLEEPTIAFHRFKNGQWNVLAGIQTSTRDESSLQMFGRLFQIREATIQNGHITITDEARPDGVRTARLEDVEVALKVYPGKAQGDLHVAAQLPNDRTPSAFSLTGTVMLSESSATFAAEEPYTARPALQFDGMLEANDLQLREVAEFFGPRPVPEQLRGAANIKSGIRIVPGVAGYDVMLTDIAANVDQLVVTAKANMAGLMTPQPTFSVTFASPSVDLHELFARFPAEWIHEQLPALVTDRQLGGTVEVVSATLTGSTAGSQQLSMTGDFRVIKGRALIGNGRVPTQDIAASISVEAGRIRVTKITGAYGAIQIADGKAIVSFLESGPWLELEINGTMAASELVRFLAKSIHSDRTASMLAQSRDIEGQAQPTFRLVGPLDKPDGVTFAGGEVVAQQASLSHPALPQRLTAIHGRIVFSQTGGAQFDQVTAMLGDTHLQINGQIGGGSNSLFQDFVIKTRGHASHLRQFVSSGGIPEELLSGIVAGRFILSGVTASPHLRGDLVLNDARLTVPYLGEKAPGAPASLEFEADMVRHVGLTITRLELVLPPLRLPLKGRITLGERFTIDAELATGTVSLSSLPEWIYKGGIEAGNFEMSMDIKGNNADWKSWRTGGWVAVTNGLMTAKGLDGHIEDLYVRLKFARNSADIKQLSFHVKDSDLSLSGTVRNWTTKPLIAAKIESPQLDIDLLIPKGERSPIRELLELLAATSQVSATFSIDKGYYKHLRFGGLSGRMVIQDGVLDLDRVAGQSGAGQVAGRLVVHLPRHAPAETEGSIRMTGIPFEALVPLLGAPDESMTGDVKLVGALRGHGRNPHGVLPTLNGKIEIVAEEGHVLKTDTRAIWKILSILNLPAVLQGKVDFEKEGLQYNKMTATLMVHNGLVQTQNFIVDSPVVKITAAGSYDMPTDQLDMVSAVSPFGPYSQFLKSIPLFGRLVAGDRKGLATALFQIKGSIDDPDVTYLPMKSFATGLTGVAQLAFDVLKNTVLLPVDILTPQEENGPAFDPALELRRPRSSSPAQPPMPAAADQGADSLTTPGPRDSIR
ncbi:MAG TPA: AsmA-like C-terminal domain-containing protein [Nitrospiraceae bacterium]|nr:AsmA-like C-terminal domain-containing protein [Nitrospiraceae bacterium]